MSVAAIALCLVLGQAPAPAAPVPAEVSAQRAAEAAERAAQAAQTAAEAAAKAAEAAMKAATPAPPEAPAWKGTVGLAIIWLTGNASTITLNANAGAERARGPWLVGVKAAAVYGQTRAPGTDQAPQTAALAAGAQLRLDRKLGEWVAVYGAVGLETDHVKSVEYRAWGEAGASIPWVDVKEGEAQKVLLRTDLGVRYAKESRFQYFPSAAQIDDVDLLGPRFGIAFRYALSKGALFTEDLEVVPGVLGNLRVLVGSATKVSVQLTRTFTLGLAFTVAYDSLPAAGKLTTDTGLTLGLEARF